MSNDRAIAARYLRSLGKTYEAIGALFDVHPTTISRDVESLASSEPPGRTAMDDLEKLLAGQDLDDVGAMHAGIARRLAEKLDKASASDKAQDSMAVPAIAKELRAVVAEIMGASTDDKEWLADLFAPVGHSEDART